MKTLQNTPAQNQNIIRDRIRIGMILVGIVTAIICSIALLAEMPSVQREASAPRLIETPKITAADVIVELASRAVVLSVNR